ncbi:hypothetical protein T4A_10245 [Trichinella pseudospiralis]|uniref:Uncharacterized protein n=1 Tax=Trichinella pseudospiralis TaxID=6337 RepID=A0A0V1EZM6_TRIPS|nr:hypothetical protein T4A_10245 [Trichinella pseudospiralis]
MDDCSAPWLGDYNFDDSRRATAEQLAKRSLETILVALDYQKITVKGYCNERRVGSGGVRTNLFVARSALNHVIDVAVLKRSPTRQHVTYLKWSQEFLDLCCSQPSTLTPETNASSWLSRLEDFLVLQNIPNCHVVRQPSEERWEAEQHKAAQRCRKKKIFAWRDYPIYLDVMVDRSECCKECQQSLVDVLYRYFPCKSFQASRIGMNAFLGTLSFEPDNLKAWHLMMSDFRCVSALRCVEWRKIRVENLKKKVRKQTFALNAFGKVNRSTEADLLFILGNGLETVLVSTRPVEVCNAREAASPRDHYSGSGSRITAKYCPRLKRQFCRQRNLNLSAREVYGEETLVT